MAIKAKLAFEEAPDFRIHLCQGVWGGVGPTGQVVANFFVDLHGHPASLTIAPSGSGQPEEVDRQPPVAPSDTIELRRQLTTAVMMTPKDAIAIGAWLTEQGTKALAMSAEADKQ